jgi:hypothetical protein
MLMALPVWSCPSGEGCDIEQVARAHLMPKFDADPLIQNRHLAMVKLIELPANDALIVFGCHFHASASPGPTPVLADHSSAAR